MLVLKQNQKFNQAYRCSVSRAVIGPGDLYYEDDLDGTIVSFAVYRALKFQKKVDTWDFSKLNELSSQQDYRFRLREYSMEVIGQTILDRNVAGQYNPVAQTENEELYNTMEMVKDGELKK